jgi:hypothetical protein
MGMYTELIIKCDIKKDLQEDVKAILNCLFNSQEEVENTPKHPFFYTSRWRAIGNCCSYYHIPKALSFFDGNYLFSRSDLKNYSSEIELFLDWLNPYIDEPVGRCIGWMWYEEDEEPSLIYKK